MILYFSGYGCNYSDPERFLADPTLPKRVKGLPRELGANVMLTAHPSVDKDKPEKRMRGIAKARRRR